MGVHIYSLLSSLSNISWRSFLSVKSYHFIILLTIQFFEWLNVSLYGYAIIYLISSLLLAFTLFPSFGNTDFLVLQCLILYIGDFVSLQINLKENSCTCVHPISE